MNHYSPPQVRSSLPFVITCAALLCLHGAATARATVVSTPFGTSYQVNVDAAGQNIPGDAANEPSLCLDPNNPNRIAIGWKQFDTTNSAYRQMGWAYSTNGGMNWTVGGTLETNVPRSDPVLASDAEGRFYFLGVQLSEPFSCDLWRSTNWGANWQKVGSASGGDKEWMVIDTTSGPGRGNIYQTWSYVSDTSDRDLTVSYDGGLTWANPIPIPHSPTWGTLDIGPEGELYLIGWDVADLGRCRLYRSTVATNRTAPFNFDLTVPIDLGGNFLAATGAEPNPAGNLGQAWVAVDRSTNQTRGNVYALCSTGGISNQCDVMFARSTDRGATWSAPQRINTDPGTNAYHWLGTLAVAPNGRVDVCWYDTRNSLDGAVSELYYCYSLDGGLSWATNRAISPPFNSRIGWPIVPQIGDYIGMVSLDDAACIAYSATFNGEQDIYFVRVAQLGAPDISVPDPGLNAALREALQKPVGPLTTQDLLSLTNLTATGSRVTSLQGLENAYNLTGLDLYHNYLTNVALLAGLTNLTTLNLGANQLARLTLPAGLTNLITLNLSDNLLTNLTLPAGLTNLTSLELRFNKLLSLRLPAGLTGLTNLDLFYNNLSSLTLPAGMTSLTTLDLGLNSLSSFAVPAALTRLTALHLDLNYYLSSLSLPAGLTNLATLDLSQNRLATLTLPPALTNLTFLDLDNNPLTTFVLPEPLAAASLAGTVASLSTQGASVYTYPLTVGLVSPQRTIAGEFQFALTGPPSIYTMLGSADLAAWNQLGTVTNKLGTAVFTDAQATNSFQKFYRATVGQ